MQPDALSLKSLISLSHRYKLAHIPSSVVLAAPFLPSSEVLCASPPPPKIPPWLASSSSAPPTASLRINSKEMLSRRISILHSQNISYIFACEYHVPYCSSKAGEKRVTPQELQKPELRAWSHLPHFQHFRIDLIGWSFFPSFFPMLPCTSFACLACPSGNGEKVMQKRGIPWAGVESYAALSELQFPSSLALISLVFESDYLHIIRVSGDTGFEGLYVYNHNSLRLRIDTNHCG